MVKMPPEVINFFRSDPQQVSKVVATVGPDGVPNVAAKGSLIAVDEETIAFAELVGTKTKANLSANGKVSAAAFRMIEGFQVKGSFQGFQTSGPLVDQFAQMLKPLGMDVREVATVKVEEVYSLSPKDAGKKIA